MTGTRRLACAAMAGCVLATPALGHVVLDAPNGGTLCSPDGCEIPQILEAGSVFTVEWHIAIAHSLQNWDLWYSRTGPAGPWTVVATNLPPGSPSVGVPHFYDWTVPAEIDDASVWLRERMDNAATDYYDVSDNPFAIVPPTAPEDVDGDGDVDVTDLVLLIAQWGTCPDPPSPCGADFDGDGSVGTLDLIALILAWG